MDETIIHDRIKRPEEAPYAYAFVAGGTRAFLRQSGEFVTIGRDDACHLALPHDPSVSALHAILWYGPLDGRPKRALFCADVSRNGTYLPSQDVAIKDVPRWQVDAKPLQAMAEKALQAIRDARKGLPASASFVPADHPHFPPDQQLAFKEACLVRVVEKLGALVALACLDDVAAAGKDLPFLRLRQDAAHRDVVQIEPGMVRTKDRAKERA